MPIQVPPVSQKTSKVVPATVAGVLLLLAVAIAENPRGIIALIVILAIGAGVWLSW